MKRIMALDIGDVRIGVALSDLLQITAQPYKTIYRVGKKKDLDEIQEIFESQEVDQVVVGLPLNMSGEEGEMVEKIKKFASSIQNRLKLENVIFVDERLTTVMAQRTLIEADVRREKRKDFVDQLAAVQILNGYLATKKSEEESK